MTNPEFIPIQFAKEGLRNAIQKVLQTGQSENAATWLSGWLARTMIKKEDGGLPPDGKDFNGVLFTLSDHAVHRQNGLQIVFSDDVISNFGGYAKGCIIQSDDTTKHFRSLIDNNTTNPNDENYVGRWEIYAGIGSIPVATSTTAGIMKVINALNSNDVGSALSAAQGKVLQDIFNKFVFISEESGLIEIPVGSKTIIIQWGVGVDYNQTSGYQQILTFRKVFPVACLFASVTTETRIDNPNNPTNWSLLGVPRLDGITAVFNEWRDGNEYSRPRYIAIGY